MGSEDRADAAGEQMGQCCEELVHVLAGAVHCGVDSGGASAYTTGDGEKHDGPEDWCLRRLLHVLNPFS